MTKAKGPLIVGVLFLGLMGCWFAFDKGITLGLFPAALPAYITLIISGKMAAVPVALLVYSILVTFFFNWLFKQKKRTTVILISLLVALHGVAFHLTTRALRELGISVVDQMLDQK